MIHYIKGELVATEPSAVIVDTDNIAFKLFVSDNTLAALSSKIGSQVKVYTYLAVREDAMDLYGFNSLEEKGAFNMLITVSGVGPKAALAILSVLTPDAFTLAVSSGDVKAISKASGVGPKIAARVVLELKDKLSRELTSVSSTSDYIAPTPIRVSGDLGKYSDALNALVVLGYTRNEAADALKGIDSKNMQLEDIITAALKNLMR
ncbi:MAG: Holliday junction branch migration protein RuvA [Ruminococcaceae bacterium]|nr:Holliday junction branch migration protein RuvA [Oscillospiraceae bacterium]